MLPSNMLLKPLNQVIDEYNDKIVVNTTGHALGKIVPAAPRALPDHAEPRGDHVKALPVHAEPRGDRVKPVPHVKAHKRET